MPQNEWTAVDDYLARVVQPDARATAALRAGEAAGLPPIGVSAPQGKLLHLLARVRGASSILEIGTLAGYSTIWLAQALRPGGRLITLEADPRHADVARANIERAGLADAVEVRVGRASESLPALDAEGRGPFDLIFIDADKPGTPEYLTWALRLSRPGTLIVIDNVVRSGAVVDDSGKDASVAGMRQALDLLAEEPRVSATVIQTVGSKGYDGFALALVTADPEPDAVEEADEESFPASDAPARTVVTGIPDRPIDPKAFSG
ncbi:MAG TPA: O-methyltransferase [Vicinamibacterales bacterium]|nr:O-methyltransferase [Vicinamibacterales bacterium]